jgi:hypothetical protein
MIERAENASLALEPVDLALCRWEVPWREGIIQIQELKEGMALAG